MRVRVHSHVSARTRVLAGRTPGLMWTPGHTGERVLTKVSQHLQGGTQFGGGAWTRFCGRAHLHPLPRAPSCGVSGSRQPLSMGVRRGQGTVILGLEACQDPCDPARGSGATSCSDASLHAPVVRGVQQKSTRRRRAQPQRRRRTADTCKPNTPTRALRPGLVGTFRDGDPRTLLLHPGHTPFLRVCLEARRLATWAPGLRKGWLH